MRRASEARGSAARVVAVAVMFGAAGCAPDLTIGEVASSAGGGGSSGATSTGASGGGGSGAGGSGGGTTGGSAPATGTVLSAESKGTASDDRVHDVAVGSQGDVFVAFDIVDETPGTGSVLAAVSVHSNGAQYDFLRGSGPHRLRALAADGEGGVIGAGELAGSTSYFPDDGLFIETAGGSDCLIARVTSDAAFDWARRIGSEAYSACEGIAIGDDGATYVVGTFTGTLDPVEAPVVSNGLEDLFMAKLGVSGAPELFVRIGDEGGQRAVSAALDGAGLLHVLAEDRGPNGNGGRDMWILVLDASGQVVREQHLGSAADETPRAFWVGADGTTAVSGACNGLTDFGGGVLGGREALVVLDPQGNHVWSRSFDSVNGVEIRGIVMDEAGNTFVGGWYEYNLYVDGTLLEGDFEGNAFFAKFGPTGELLALRVFAEPGYQAINAMTPGTNGHVLAVGEFSGDVELDGIDLVSDGGSDLFLIELAP